MPHPVKETPFVSVLLAYMDDAYNLARWLVRDPHDAEDVVQEAYLRAVRFASGFRGGNARAWFLAIVRNAAFTWLKRKPTVEVHQDHYEEIAEDVGLEPETFKRVDSEMLRAALSELQPEFREIIALRDLEELAYKEIADVLEVPIGTVMSRLARARRKLACALKARIAQES